MSGLVLYALLTPALFYLGSRAVITAPIWNRYPPRVATFMDCPACVGFWWGLLIALTLGRSARADFLGLDPLAWPTAIIAGLCAIVWTPIVAGFMQRGFDSLGSAVEPHEPHYEYDNYADEDLSYKDAQQSKDGR